MSNIFIACIGEESNRWKRAGSENRSKPSNPYMYKSTNYTYKEEYDWVIDHGDIQIRSKTGVTGTALLKELKPKQSTIA